MANARLIVFDVDRGSCAFLRTPANYGIMIDCGRSTAFSPVHYLLANELNTTIRFLGCALTWLIVSHPHDDHIEDIDSILALCRPAIITGQQYAWPLVKVGGRRSDYANLDKYADWFDQRGPATFLPQFGLDVYRFGLTPAEAIRLDPAKFVNNSSIAVVVTIPAGAAPHKILFGGDIEAAGWDLLLRRAEVRDAVAGVTVYVASHHGHSSGFSQPLFDAMGVPAVNLVSTRAGDESVEGRYSDSAHATGLYRPADSNPRRMFSTRVDGSLFLEFPFDDGARLHRRYLGSNVPLYAALLGSDFGRRSR